MEIQEGTKMLSQFFVLLHALKKEECCNCVQDARHNNVLRRVTNF